MSVKALFISAQRPYNDFGDILQIARAEGCKILGCTKVKVLNILPCNYPVGYVVVVQNSGDKRGKIECLSESSKTN